MNRLKDKIILISGGSGLLGRQIIADLKAESAITVNLDISLESTPDLSSLQCDITDTASIDSCIKRVMDHFGKIDGLVNNAYPRTSDWGSRFEDIRFDSWQTNINSQLNSYFYLTQVVSRHMCKMRAGSIINMASVYGIVGPDFGVYEGTNMTMPAAYSAIKGGLVNLTRYLASYFGPHNVRVNTVSPGGIFDNQNPKFVSQYNCRVPMRRMGTPDDISPAVVFLLSEESKYITGQNLIIDGGWTAI